MATMYHAKACNIYTGLACEYHGYSHLCVWIIRAVAPEGGDNLLIVLISEKTKVMNVKSSCE